MNYDPDITFSKQTVEVTFQQWDYSAARTTTVSGNCTGRDVLEAAMEQIVEELEETDEPLILKNPSGDEIELEPDLEDLGDFIVSAKITAITKA